MKKNNLQKVVIIGHGYTSRLGVIRSLAQIGCDITVIVMTDKKRFGDGLDTTKPIDGYSKYINRLFFCYKKDERGLIKILLEKCKDESGKVVLFPDSDFSASVIDNNMDALREYFVFPHIHNQQGEVTKWMDKGLQKELAKSVGLDVASSFTVDVVNGKYELPALVNYPCFPKPLVTIRGDKYMKRCDNEEELRRVIEHLGSKGDNRVLVEDFKVIDEEYAVLGFSDGNDVTIPGVIHFLRPSKSHFGLAMQGEVLPVTGFEDIIAKFKKFAIKVGFVGVFDIDFFVSGGIFFFDEMNLRFGGSGYAITKMGVNLPAMMVKYFSGESYKDWPDEISGKAVFVNDRMLGDDWYQGFLTTKEYHCIQDASVILFVKDNEDPAPQEALERKMKRMRFRRFLRNMYRDCIRHK
jgi:predicted ATP-grasp superfamily ATP-dependent carboligase